EADPGNVASTSETAKVRWNGRSAEKLELVRATLQCHAGATNRVHVVCGIRGNLPLHASIHFKREIQQREFRSPRFIRDAGRTDVESGHSRGRGVMDLSANREPLSIGK